MSKKHRSLRRLLLTGIVVTASLAALLTVYATRHFLNVEAEELLDAQLARAARLFDAAWSAIRVEPGTVLELPDLGMAIDQQAGPPDGHEYELHVALQIFDANGRLLMRSSNAPATPLAPLAAGFVDTEEGWRVFVLESRGDGARILVAEDDRARHELRVEFSAVALLIMLAGFGLLLVVLLIQVDRGLAPVRRLALRLADRGPGNLEKVSIAGLPLELVPLVQALNGYLESLRQAFRTEQEFTARAAHELRTPLAAIRIHAENALAARTDEDRTRSLVRLREGIDRATRLTGQLLLLTRLQSGQLRERFTKLNVRRLLARAARGQQPIVEALGQRIDFEAPPELTVTGDADFLLIALDTLIANAVRHAGGDHVSLRAARAGGRVRLEVIDRGPGPDEDRLRTMRESLCSASVDHRPGLGLEIANWIARAHGGELRLERGEANVGLIAAMILPSTS